MPGSIFKFGFVVEGHGEVEAAPLLVRRICTEVLGFFMFETTRPVRVSRSKLVRSGEFERALKLAFGAVEGAGAVLVLLDADDDAPCVLGPSLKHRALSIAQSNRVSIVAA